MNIINIDVVHADQNLIKKKNLFILNFIYYILLIKDLNTHIF